MSLEGVSFSDHDLIEVVKTDQTDLFFEYYLNLNNLRSPENVGSGGILHTAIKRDNLELIEYLIQEKAYLLVMDGTGYSPVELAAYLRKWEIVELFLKNGVDINYVYPNGYPLSNIVLTQGYRSQAERFKDIKQLIKMGANPFMEIIKYLISIKPEYFDGTVDEFDEMRMMIDQIIFSENGELQGELKIPDQYLSESCICFLSNPENLTNRLTEWISKNMDQIKDFIRSSSSGLSFAETVFLTKHSFGRQFADLLDPSDFSKILSPAAQKIVSESKPLDGSDIVGCNSLGYKIGKDLSKMTLAEACFDYYDFWTSGRSWGIFSSGSSYSSGLSGWRVFVRKFIIPSVVFDQSFVLHLIKMYQSFRRTFNSNLPNLIDFLDDLLGIHPNVGIKNVSFGCCDLLNYCVKIGCFNLANRILQSCELKTIRLVCNNRLHDCDCGKNRCAHLSSQGCGSLIQDLLNRFDLNNDSVFKSVKLVLESLSSKGVDFKDFARKLNSISSYGFKLIARYVIKQIDWSDLSSEFRSVLDGPCLKELDAIDPFGEPFIFSRTDPISNEDLQEIDSSRLVIVNSISWDLENLVQYVTKVTKGQNAFDPKHPFKGRPIWLNKQELDYLFRLRIEIPDQNLDRVSNLSDDQPENPDTRVGSGRNGKMTYGDLLRGYLEIEPFLNKIDRADFDELYRICSIFWARGEPFDQAISTLLTPDELSDWKKRWFRRLNSNSMPSELPSQISHKIEGLKFIQMAALDIWFHTTMKNKTSALGSLSQICFGGYSKINQEIIGVLNGEYCVMAFSYNVCRGYIRCKLIWDSF